MFNTIFNNVKIKKQNKTHLNKKADEKTLQLVFTIFILLIVAVVVLTLFFKFITRGGNQMNKINTIYIKDQEKQLKEIQCQMACSNIHDENSLIDFCLKTVKIDGNNDGLFDSRIKSGKWSFCEAKVPCFVLVDNCNNGIYNWQKCVDVLNKPNVFKARKFEICNLFRESLTQKFEEQNTNIFSDVCKLDSPDTIHSNWQKQVNDYYYNNFNQNNRNIKCST